MAISILTDATIAQFMISVLCLPNSAATGKQQEQLYAAYIIIITKSY